MPTELGTPHGQKLINKTMGLIKGIFAEKRSEMNQLVQKHKSSSTLKQIVTVLSHTENSRKNVS